MANINFTLGVCDAAGHNYRFDYISGKYQIIQTDDEIEKPLFKFNDAKEAYSKWNELKSTEKFRK